MKSSLSPFLFIVLFLISTGSFAQSERKELSPGYYVVVAAYAKSKENMAIMYVNSLRSKGYNNANYGFNTSRNLYYVYLNYFTTLKEGILDMLDTRKKGVFTDAWVRVIPGVIKPPVEESDTLNIPLPEPVDTTAVSIDTIQVEVEEELEEKVLQTEPLSLTNSEVFFNLFNATNNRIIEGDVEIVDPERARLLDKAKSNEYVLLPDPKNNTGKLLLIAEVFGYRKMQYEINANSPLTDSTESFVEMLGTTFVIYFDMVRYRKGDIVTLYNVYFYNDAAIMMPESKYELNSLLELMQENKNYRIRLHGHTNGNYHGKIITGVDDNFFSLNGETRTTLGSAKELSGLRAKAIANWLVNNGIDPSRVEIKAWGGRRPLFDKNGPNARKNVRVEVEVLED